MSKALLILIALAASLLTADALNCYACSRCSASFKKSQQAVLSDCTHCARTIYKDSSTVSRYCASFCVSGTDSFGNSVDCCNNKSYCNSTSQLGGFRLTTLLSGFVLAVFCSRL
ncbi:hypothetical protein BOX15_Mlig024928g1 [Macrostomum lignano]|uniref:UPAR/Ly6 domain-containing protein n=1 Tax=Macrostomum lignano TaxID=282301 RepID=A0A267EGD2_9PLAT|nr:hypothetical protein BOX15_Mlig025168g1 [Macrostomum lignano]PAA81485.1 hypothetical protein BOX15_Mlig024928g1 [Macrostomum lignano]